MTSIENAREFLNSKGWTNETEISYEARQLSNYSKHVLKQVISFLEANEKKPIKSIINELKGKV